jgi:hypothetical protein
MKKLFLGLLCALLIGVTAFAEVDIPQDKRVQNFDSGCCVWCACENLANIHGIKQLKGIAKYRHDNYGKKKTWVEGTYMIDPYSGAWIRIEGPHWSYINEAPGTPERVKEEFKRLKVKYKMQTHGNYETDILKEAVDKDLGCAVGLKDYPSEGSYHMVTLTDLTKDKFVFVDNNKKCPRVEKTREWFDQHWTGYTILLYPDLPTTAELRETPKPAVDESRKKD